MHTDGSKFTKIKNFTSTPTLLLLFIAFPFDSNLIVTATIINIGASKNKDIADKTISKILFWKDTSNRINQLQ